NLMVVDPDTPYEKIKVMDFGLATLRGKRRLDNSADSNVEFAVGTPGYMSPEQVRGEEVDHRSDIYSVGIILYEVMTSKLPFTGKSSMEVLVAQVNAPPPPFARGEKSPWIPPAVEKVVMACLAKERDQRPSSAMTLSEMFEAALEQGEEQDLGDS